MSLDTANTLVTVLFVLVLTAAFIRAIVLKINETKEK